MTDQLEAGRSRRRIWLAVGVSAALVAAASIGAMAAMRRGSEQPAAPAARATAPPGTNAGELSGGPADLTPPGGAAVTPSPVALSGPTGPSVNVPVLLYHYVRVVRNGCDSLGMSLSVTPTVLNQQLTLLQLAGYHVISLGTLMAAVLHGGLLPSHPIVLTFDDGYADFATAAVPILLAHQMTATDFVVPGFLGRSAYMTAAQVVEVEAEGMGVGAHTMHHVALAHTSLAVARSEIAGSRSYLQRLLGIPVTDFAYPYGDFNATVEQLVAQAGFTDGFTTLPGTRQSAAFRYALPRVRVGNGLAYFASQLGVGGAALRAAASTAPPLPAGEDPGSPVSPSTCRPHATPAPPPAHTPTATPVVARLPQEHPEAMSL